MACMMAANLQQLAVGPWTFVNTSTVEGYSSVILEFDEQPNVISVKVMSTDLATILCSFTFRRITGQDFTFFSRVHGSVNDILVRVVLELDQVTYVDYNLERALSGSNLEESSRGHIRETNRLAKNEGNLVEKRLRCHLVTLMADPYETGSLRDIVLSSTNNSAMVGNASPQGGFQLLTRSRSMDEDVDGTSTGSVKRRHGKTVLDSVAIKESPDSERPVTSSLHLVPSLPFWLVFIPWWLYCKPLRRAVQISITLYVMFSVLWAFWQLHRHFYLIQALVAPILHFAQLYLSSILTLMDYFFSYFTSWWYKFIQPIHILLGFSLAPLITFSNTMWTFFKPIVTSQLVRTTFVPLLNVLWKPLQVLLSIVQKTRISLASLDVGGLRLSIAKNVAIGSMKAIWTGFLKLFKYSKDVLKQKRALKDQLDNPPCVSPQGPIRRPSGSRRTSGPWNQ